MTMNPPAAAGDWLHRNLPSYFIEWAETTGAAARDADRADHWLRLCDRTKARTAQCKQTNGIREDLNNG